MNLMCPVSSVYAAKTFVEIGIKEIYVGVNCDEFGLKNVTFTGRTKSLCNGESVQLKNFEELKNVVNICHEHGVIVNFTANVRNLSESLSGEYLAYVDAAVKCGVDTLIVGSILSLILLQGKYNIPLHSSTFFYPFNKYNVDFFHQLKVKRIILPTALSIKEIEEVINYIKDKDYDMEVEVFGHFGCSNINGRCNIFNNPPSLCRGKYRVYDSSYKILDDNYSIIDAGKDCTMCSLTELQRIGVASLKIMGRGLSVQLVGSLITLYHQALQIAGQNQDSFTIKKNLLDKAPWWENAYCNEQRCMYRITETSKFYV